MGDTKKKHYLGRSAAVAAEKNSLQNQNVPHKQGVLKL
jgi:hypothetical protein